MPEPPADGSHYRRIGEVQAGGYHRNAFAQGTANEVAVLAAVLDLHPGDRVLDVGCGNGRHVTALRAQGIHAIGVDLSPEVLRDGPPTTAAARAQALPLADGSVDAAFSVCQGGFSVDLGLDGRTVDALHRVVRPGGRVALSAFSLVFAVRFMGEGEAMDLTRGRHHHVADVRGPGGARASIDLWTTAYTPAHLVEVLDRRGFTPLGVAGVEAGAYQRDRSPTIADPELLVWAERR